MFTNWISEPSVSPFLEVSTFGIGHGKPLIISLPKYFAAKKCFKTTASGWLESSYRHSRIREREISKRTPPRPAGGQACGCYSLVFVFLDLSGGLHSVDYTPILRTLPHPLPAVFSIGSLFSIGFSGSLFHHGLSSWLSPFPGGAALGLCSSTLNTVTQPFRSKSVSSTQTSSCCHLYLAVPKGVACWSVCPGEESVHELWWCP